MNKDMSRQVYQLEAIPMMATGESCHSLNTTQGLIMYPSGGCLEMNFIFRAEK
jgi:hypothetical protein